MKTSIVVCAYNEEETIREVVLSCRRFNPGHEIIVVDDGSTDRTAEIVASLCESNSIVYERLPQNSGKSNAMIRGVEISSGDVIVFFDADVTNVREEHFRNMVVPLEAGSADMVLGQPTKTLIDFRINPFRSLTGERALFRRDIEPILDDMRDIRFGVETFINLYYQASGKRIAIVLLDGLKHPTKYGKVAPIQATREFVKEGHEIGMTLLRNQNLIIKRIEVLLGSSGTAAIKRIQELQAEVNRQIDRLSERFRP